MEQARQLILEVAENILKERFPATENQFCPCDFPEHCPYYRHQYPAAAPEPARQGTLPGIAAADTVERYASLQTQIKELQAQLEEAKQAIIDFCQAEDLNRVFGSEHEVTYKITERTGFSEDEIKALLEPEEDLDSARRTVRQVRRHAFAHPHYKGWLDVLEGREKWLRGRRRAARRAFARGIARLRATDATYLLARAHLETGRALFERSDDHVPFPLVERLRGTNVVKCHVGDDVWPVRALSDAEKHLVDPGGDDRSAAGLVRY